MVVNHIAYVAYFEFADGVNQTEQSIDVIRRADRPRLIGEHFYVVGAFRRVAKRLGPNKWVGFTPDPDLDDDTDPYNDKGVL